MTYRQAPLWLVAFVLSWTAVARSAEPHGQQQPVYLGDAATDLIVSSNQAWGRLGWNTAVKPVDRPATPLRIKDRIYQRGLGHHAPGEILVDLSGRFKTFEADLGVQWQRGTNVASVVFEIYVDNEKRFQSGVMGELDPPQHVSISVEGGDVLRLVAGDAGDGITCDCADWADARLIPLESAARPAPGTFLDAAPFAHVVTSDPERMDGTHASRIQEFPAEDVFLSTEVLAGADGMYAISTAAKSAAIGLEWEENRDLRRVGLEFAESSTLPDMAAVQLQYWMGESPWQGEWKRLETAAQTDGRTATWQLGFKQIPSGTPRVRWVFPRSKKPVMIERFHATTRSRSKETSLTLLCEPPRAGTRCQVVLYNGTILEPDAEGTSHACTWDTSKPLRLKVRYSAPWPYKADRTVLRLTFPDAELGVAVEDLLDNDCVYVPSAGLFAVREPAPVTLAKYKQSIAGRKTIREVVASRPDQTFGQAMAEVHHEIQNLGPTMVSLACDNRKFVAEREGAIAFDLYEQPDEKPVNIPKQYRLTPRFGDRPEVTCSRRLEGEWLPIPESTFETPKVRYRQRCYVVPVDDEPSAGGPLWLRDRAACVVEYEVENKTDDRAEARVELALTGPKQAIDWQSSEGRYFVGDDNRLVLAADASGARPLTVATEGSVLRLTGLLQAKGNAHVLDWIPAWKADRQELARRLDGAVLRGQVERYWKSILEPAMQVELPEPLLTSILRASQVHCLMAARNEQRGSRVSPWIASDRYGPLESEANSIIHGMDLWGHRDFARRSLDFFLVRYNEAGYLTTGYTLVGTGWNLWTLAEYFDLARDRAWLEQNAATVARGCQWLVRQRAKTKRLDARGEKVPGYGLMPPGVSADWNRFAYRFFNDAHYCAGLTAAAGALKAIGYPGADALVRDAAAYREDLRRAFRWMRARMPVVKLQNGTWTPNHPGIVGYFGNLEGFTPGEDANRSWAGSVEIGSHWLAALGIVDPQSDETASMLDYLEDHQFLRSGMGDYPEEASHEAPFDLGGFAKVQPYYGRVAEIYAARDDVKPFVRSYFNAIGSLLSCENLSFWEHFHNRGAWNKTHETGWFLAQSRLLLVQERGEEIWLAPMVPSGWLGDGMRVRVERAPTRFGEVGYEIRSAAGKGVIEATVVPPAESTAKSIVLRLRHPDGKKMRKVWVNQQAYERLDPEQETITLPGAGKTIDVEAEY